MIFVSFITLFKGQKKKKSTRVSVSRKGWTWKMSYFLLHQAFMIYYAFLWISFSTDRNQHWLVTNSIWLVPPLSHAFLNNVSSSLTDFNVFNQVYHLSNLFLLTFTTWTFFELIINSQLSAQVYQQRFGLLVWFLQKMYSPESPPTHTHTDTWIHTSQNKNDWFLCFMLLLRKYLEMKIIFHNTFFFFF